MTRYAATNSSRTSWDISQIDADGVGRRFLMLSDMTQPGGSENPIFELSARLLVMAMNMPGGIETAIDTLRAKTIDMNG